MLYKSQMSNLLDRKEQVSIKISNKLNEINKENRTSKKSITNENERKYR